MGKQHIIEFNGKRYDALTGKVIATVPVSSTNRKQNRVNKSQAISIDGFAKPSHPVATPRQTNQTAGHAAEKSKTLMRKTVTRPKAVKAAAPAALKEIVKTTGNSEKMRLQHAQTIPKSPSISRFSVAGTSSSSPKIATKISEAQRKTPASTKAVVAQPAVSVTASSLITRAFAKVEPKETPHLKREKRTARIGRKLHLTSRQVSIGGFALATLLIIGFFAYQNASNISMRIASSRAGIHGSLPGYQPAGFGIAGGIAYNPGQITINYKSTSDNRNFKITQNVSDWNSQALLDNYVAANHPNNQTVQDRGKTIYLYDGSNATWVDGGIWYRIEGDSQLNSDQLLNIAASL